MRSVFHLRVEVIAVRRFLLVIAIILCSPVAVLSLESPGSELSKVGIHATLGTKLDLSLPFTDSDGKAVTLRELVPKNRPAVIIPAYYDCPRLCGMLQSGVSELLNKIELNLGPDFTVISASFNPEDTVAKAAERAKQFRTSLTKSGIDTNAWHFLIGSQSSIDGLMQRLGFEYQKDDGEYAHTAAIFMVTPNGELSQYLAGITFDPSTARYALVEASQGNIGTALDQVFLFCFRYDHLQGKYLWAAFSVMRLGGFLTLSFLAFLIYRLWYGERRSRGAIEAGR